MALFCFELSDLSITKCRNPDYTLLSISGANDNPFGFVQIEGETIFRELALTWINIFRLQTLLSNLKIGVSIIIITN